MSSKAIKGITIELGGNSTKLDKALEGPRKKARDLQSELKEVNRLLKLDPTNTELLAQKQKLLKEAISTTKEKLETLKEAEKQAQEQFKRGEISEEQYRALQREIIKTEQELKKLEDEAAKSNVTLTKVAEVADKIGDAAVNAGEKMLPLTGAVAGVGVASAKAAMDYETAFAGVKKTTDELLDTNGNVIISYDDLSDGIREMSKRMPQSAAEIAGVAEAAGQLGVKTEDLLDFTETMVMLGDTTNLSSDQAATSIARFTNITGLSRSEVDRLGSTLVALGNNSAATEADIMSMASGLASAGSQVGMTDAEILGLAATLSSLGLEAQAGGSAFSKVMKQMQVDVETQSGNIENFAAVAGMSVQEFSDLFQNDATAAMQAFIVGLGDTESMGMSTIAMLDEMGLTELRLSDALMRTSNANELMTDSLDLARSAWDENNALSDEAEKKYETMESRISMVKNRMVDLGIQIGEILMPYIEKLIESVTSIIDRFSGMSDEQKKTIVTIAGIVAAIGPALIVFGKLSQGLSSMIGLYQKLTAAKAAETVATKANTASTIAHKVATLAQTAAAKIASVAQGAFNAVMSMNPIALIVIAIAGLIAALVLLYNKCEWFRNLVNAIWGSIKAAFFAVWDAIKTFFTETLPNAFNTVIELFSSVGQWFTDRFTEAYDGIVGVFQGIGEWFAARWQDIQNALAAVGIWFLTMFQTAYNNVVQAFQAIGQWFAARWQDIQNALAAVGTWFLTMFQTAYNNVTLVFQAIGRWFSARWQDIQNVFSSVVSFFRDTFTNAWNAIVNAFSSVGSFFGNLWNDIVTRFTDIGVKIGEAVGGAFKAIVNGVLSTAENIVNGFLGMINGAIDVINAIPGVSISKVSLLSFPRLAKGGVLHEGQAIMAEAGPELITVSNGRAIVTPLTRGAKNTAVEAAGGAAGGGGLHVENKFYTNKHMDAYETARLNKRAIRTTVRQLNKGRV